jgi:hypothetical protein
MYSLINFQKKFYLCQGLGVSSMKKEYTLKIIYDPNSDEIGHLSEKEETDILYVLEVNGKDIPISDEMGDYMMKHLDNTALGLA